DVLKAPVDGGEAHVGDRIDLLELLHDPLAEAARGQLALAARDETMPNAPDHGLDRFRVDRPLLERPREPRAQLVLEERLAPPVGLDDLRQAQLRALEGREALAADLALAAPAHRIALFGEARVDHAGFVSRAEWAAHTREPGVRRARVSPVGRRRRSLAPAGSRSRSL